MTKQIISASKIISLAIVLSFGLSYVYAWTAPSATPPTGNVSAPINTGDNTQYKAGNLVLNDSALPFVNGLIVRYGNVGIGTASPSTKLEVAGNVNVGGNIDATGSIVAPGITIGGVNYTKFQYFNSSEDTYVGVPGAVNPVVDTCNGNVTLLYTCPVSYAGSCTDISVLGGQYNKRNVVCLVNRYPSVY